MRTWSTLVVFASLTTLTLRAQADWFHDLNDGQEPDDWEFSVPPIFSAALPQAADASAGFL
jgi:hypothetical protein